MGALRLASLRVIALALALSVAAPALAQRDELRLPLESPYAGVLRQHYYAQLAKSPWKALGFELLLPGAGYFYTGLHAVAAATLGVTLLGAGMWVGGALRDRAPLAWAGLGTFAAARGYGVVSAPIGAALFNAALRRQLGVMRSF